jgi:antitoxin component YwqK of YwqJK toxin-antitoxin module
MSKTICSSNYIAPKRVGMDLFRENPNRNEYDSDEYRILKDWEKNFLILGVCFGEAEYPFTTPVNGHYEPFEGGFTFQAEIFIPIVGKGQSRREAKLDWDRLFHLRFHELYVKCWWERTEKEQKDWRIFEDAVDITAFRKATPLEFTETGKILSIGQIKDGKLSGVEIEWLDGQSEVLNCAVTFDFAVDFVLNNYYEIKLLRDYQTSIVVKVLDAVRIDYKENTKEEIDAWLGSQLGTKKITDTAWVTLTMQE